MSNRKESGHQTWCMVCCCAYHPQMLTGYCLLAGADYARCDKCGKAADCAMVKVPVLSKDQ